MAQLFSAAPYRALDANNHVLPGALLYFYQTGTTTLQTVYADSAATTPLTNPVVADSGGLFVPIYLAGTTLYKAVLQTAGAVTVQTVDPVNSSSASPSFTPQGRLTLASGTPVMTSDQTGATTIYYTPYTGNQIPVYDGTQFSALTFTELTNATAASSSGNAGPAAVTTNSNYDLFVWSNGGTPTLTRGPAWSSDTSRGTGAGTTELARVSGVWTNARAITNGPAANRGTYVGTVRSDGSSQINWALGGQASGGTAALLNVWNAYNRTTVRGLVTDNTDSWTYSALLFRMANSSAGMRVSFLQGLQEDYFDGRYTTRAAVTAGSCFAALAYNLTSVAFTAAALATVGRVVEAVTIVSPAEFSVQGFGFNFVQAMECGDGTNTATFNGDTSRSFPESGLNYDGRF